MKKMNSKGFTLIELLAVITIMGILMMVAIPNVSRTIENSRRDTFATIAKEYINAVRNGVLADEIECYYDSEWRPSSSTPNGTYYFPICTATTKCTETVAQIPAADIVSSTTDLLESGGKSSWGNADVYGYVQWVKEDTGAGDHVKTKYTYTIVLADIGKHGIAKGAPKKENEIKRSSINTKLADSDVFTNKSSVATAVQCKVA